MRTAITNKCNCVSHSNQHKPPKRRAHKFSSLSVMSEDSCCKQEIEYLQAKINSLTLESDELKQKYKQLLIVNLEKDVKIRNLKKELLTAKFSKFKEKISESCFSSLQIIGNSVPEDSTFICCVINDLYDITTLKNLTLSGRSKTGGKVEISHEKRDILEEIFSQRLDYMPRQEVNEFRRNNLNKLIRNAIDNANKKKTISA